MLVEDNAGVGSGFANEKYIQAGARIVAYETIEVGRSLPLLVPMSEVAGRMSVQVGASFSKNSTVVKAFCSAVCPASNRRKSLLSVVALLVPTPRDGSRDGSAGNYPG